MIVSQNWLRICLAMVVSCFELSYGEYLGCYQDSDERLMKGYLQNLVLTLTPAKCIDLCQSKDFKYAGLKSRISCFCDRHEPPHRYITEESSCRASCVGDNTKICGGDNAVSVYSVLLTHKEGVILPIIDTFVGCYKDNNFDQLLSGYQESILDNTPEKCKAICSRRGYLYAGVEYGVQCFCGDIHPPPALLRNDARCSTQCPQNPSLKCGGSGVISVYDTGITDIPSIGMKLGCFDDEDPRILGGYKIDLVNTNSPRRCLNVCRSLGYKYSGVEYGVECFCGNFVTANVSRDTGDDVCNTTCPGDPFETCGNNWKLSLYTTGFSEIRPIIRKLGCLLTNDISMYMRYRQDFNKTTSENCASICYNKGFWYSTLIFRTECWCGNNLPNMLQTTNGTEDCGILSSPVYDTGYVVHQPGIKYIGCYELEERRNTLKDFCNSYFNLTPDKCAGLCFNKGYLYSGTRNKNECICGDTLLERSYKAQKYECNSPCSGDGSKHCGGDDKVSVYATGISDLPTTGKLIGCFFDGRLPRLLEEHKTDLEKTNSPRRCLNYCRTLGYKFAGLEYEKECFCGNKRPSAGLDAPDSDCNTICSGDNTEYCGGGWRLAVYRTGNNPSLTPDPVWPDGTCELSETMVNGKHVCSGAVIFKDAFSTSLIAGHWRHTVKIADEPDYEFVTFTSDPANSFQRSGTLVIKPTLLTDKDVHEGNITLDGCTGLAASRECELAAFSYNILPPVRTARLQTRNTFSFRYGIVEIRARLPVGDWIVPELWLLPKDQSYGTSYRSGKIRIAMTRGNRYLTFDGKAIDLSLLESGVMLGSEGTNVRARSVTNKITGSWAEHSHNYTLVWTPDNLSFFVDGQSQQALLPPSVRLAEFLGFNSSVDPAWSTGSRIAPFDADFYLSLGLSVGGGRDFPDGSINKNKEKPWSNFKLKAMLNFWLDKDSWFSSWDEEKSSLIIEHVKITAL